MRASDAPGGSTSEAATGGDIAAAGFVSRAFAMVIDIAVVVGVIVGAEGAAAGIELVLPKWVWLSTAISVGVSVVSSIVPFLYFFVAVAVVGQTLGKAIVGLRVLSLDGERLSVSRSLLRTVAYLISLLPLFAGFLWVLVDGDRRGWHDHIVGSQVVYEPGERRS